MKVKEFLKKERGITLIALIVTIIVLSILAGVSISMITGNEGILKKARDAAEAQIIAGIEDKINNVIAEVAIEKKTKGEITDNERTAILNELDGIEGVNSVEYDETNGKREITVKYGNKTKTIDLGTLKVEASQIVATNYGEKVNYKDLDGNTSTADWKIFYKGKDESNNDVIFLIASDYLPIGKIPNGAGMSTSGTYQAYWPSDSVPDASTIDTTSKFLYSEMSKMNSGNSSYKCVTKLLDTNVWTSFVNEYATSAIGSPTVEMWMKSWNAKYPDDKLEYQADKTGYQVRVENGTFAGRINSSVMSAKDGYDDKLYYPHKTKESNCHAYWLASPSAYNASGVLFVDYDGNVYFGGYSNPIYGVRPVVSLRSGVKLTKTGDIWELSN